MITLLFDLLLIIFLVSCVFRHVIRTFSILSDYRQKVSMRAFERYKK